MKMCGEKKSYVHVLARWHLIQAPFRLFAVKRT